jgi:hypothetical protein
MTRGAGFEGGVFTGRATSAGREAAAGGGLRRSFLSLLFGLFAAKSPQGSKKNETTITVAKQLRLVESTRNR